MKEPVMIIEPGLYQLNMSGATLGECWRLGGSINRFMIALYWKFTQKTLNYLWMPFKEAREYCTLDELGERSKIKLSPQVKSHPCLVFRKAYFTPARPF